MGTNNLLSVTYMVQKEYTVNFGEKLCEILRTGSIIGIAKYKKGPWVLDGNSVVSDPQVMLSQLCHRPVVTYCMVYYYTKRVTLARLLANKGPVIYVVHLNRYFVIFL